MLVKAKMGLIMKQIEKSTVILAAMLLFCCACSDSGAKPKEPIAVKTHASMRIEIDTLVAGDDGVIHAPIVGSKRFSQGIGNINLEITNLLQEEIMTGEMYKAQTLKSGEWVEVPLELAFNSIGLPIALNETRSFQCSLSPSGIHMH